MMRKKLLMTGLISAVSVVSMSVGAFAASNLEQISAYLNKGISIKLQGQAWQAKDEDGNVQYPITYNGSTYVPLRAAGEALGIKVGWDAATETVLLGEAPAAGTPIEAGTYTAGDFTFKDVSVKKGDYGVDIAAEATVAKDIKLATFMITFYDAAGKRIGTAVGSVRDLAKGESKTIAFVTLDEGVEKYATMKFQVDAQM